MNKENRGKTIDHVAIYYGTLLKTRKVTKALNRNCEF